MAKLWTYRSSSTEASPTLYADGNPIADYTIKGNAVQNGTPTPDNPVDVNGVGNKTANLLDMSTVSVGYHLDLTTGLPIGFGNSRMATLAAIDVSQFSAVTLAYTSVGDTIQFMYSIFDGTDTLIERVVGKESGDSIDVSSAAKLYIAFYRNAALTINSVEEPMLNEGATPQSYEPYGYKIPISSGQQTTNIYLGSTQTTRKIKKLVLDGTENWNESLTNHGYRFGLNVSNSMQSDTMDVRSLCTHLPLTVRGGTGLDVQNVYVISASNDLIIKLSNSDRLPDFKSWLSQQYANGTPVTIWYVLTIAETAAVNEPLMKIGDYADSITGSQSQISIPTTAGENSITFLTDIQPSQFEVPIEGWYFDNPKKWDGSKWV
jgi:hypothetical protein